MKKIGRDKELAEFVGMTPHGILKMKTKNLKKYECLKIGFEVLKRNLDVELIFKNEEALKIRNIIQ